MTHPIHNDGVKWHRPTSLKELLDLKDAYPGNDSKIVCGNTEIGVEIKFKKASYPRRIHVSGNTIEELGRISMNYDNGEAVFGAAISLSDLEHVCSSKEASNVERFIAISKQLKWFAGRQIRNVSTLGGNIVTGSPISDLNPLWIALDAIFVVTSKQGGNRYVKARDFFLAYRKVDLKPDEILKQVELKAFNDSGISSTTTGKEYFHEYKQSHRREDDIAIVTCGARAFFDTSTGECLDFSIGFGGLSFKTIFCSQTASGMVGKRMTKETLDFLMSAIEKECLVDENAPGGMAQYRTTLAKSFVFKFFLHCVGDLRSVVNTSSSSTLYELQQNELSSLGRNERQSVVSGAQYFTKKQPVKSSANLWRINPRTYKLLEKRCIATMQQSLKDVSTQLWFYLQSRTGRLFRWIARALWKMFQAYSGIFPQKIFPSTDPIPSARLHTTRRFLPRNMSRALVKLSVLSSLKPER